MIVSSIMYVFVIVLRDQGSIAGTKGVQVKKIEDVVYDLSLRNLIPRGDAST